MAALDFPASPAVGQIFAPSGAPAYVWDGFDWAVITPGDRNPQSAAFRNIFINGNFGLDQRGQAISSLVGSAWAADRWLLQATGSNISRTFGAFSPGQPQVPGEPTRYLLLNVQSVAGAGNTVYIVQKVENIRSMGGGEQFTLSFYGMCNVAKPVAFEIQRAFGTGGSPSASDAFNCQKRFDLTSSWQRFTHTFTMPTLVGKSFGTSFDDCLWCILWLDAGSNFASNASGIGQLTASALSLANFQLEHGPVATEFERRPPAVELALCQRFYEQGNSYEVFPSGFTNGASTFHIPFRVTKRAAATGSFGYTSLGNRQSSTSYGGALDAFHLQVISTAAGNVFQAVAWNATAEL